MIASETTAFAARSIFAERIGSFAEGASLTFRALTGGTEAAGVFQVVARYQDAKGRPQRQSMVLKHLQGRARREGLILRRLLLQRDLNIVPHLIGVFEDGANNSYLGLEEVRRFAAWPWRDTAVTAKLMHELGDFHESAELIDMPLADWDYAAELDATAVETRERLDQCRHNSDLADLVAHFGIVDRVVQALPRLRRLLLNAGPMRARLIHGDVHPGNALIRNGAIPEPVLIDWGRARLGSPLEDVSSMLQSLRFYEPAALQRHDRLLKDYLSGTGSERRITDELRSAYWTAGASNALAGALNVSLMVVADEALPKRQRHAAYLAARDWLRVIRRAHAWAL